jgi:hypothetical protein
MGYRVVRNAGIGRFFDGCVSRQQTMKFHVMNALTAAAGLVLVSTLGEPLLTDAVRMPLQIVVVVFTLVTIVL